MDEMKTLLQNTIPLAYTDLWLIELFLQRHLIYYSLKFIIFNKIILYLIKLYYICTM